MKRPTISKQDLFLGAALAYCKAHAVMVEKEDMFRQWRTTQTSLAYTEACDALAERGEKLKKFLEPSVSIGEAIEQLLLIVKDAYETHHPD